MAVRLGGLRLMRFACTLLTRASVVKAWSVEEYYDWLEKARTARDNYLEDKISKEEALNIICIE